MRKPRLRHFSAVLLAFVSGDALAQVDPGAIHQSSRDTLEYYRADKLLQDTTSEAGSAQQSFVIEPPAAAPQGDGNERNLTPVQVTRIETTPSQILSDAQLRLVLARYENRELAMWQLYEAAEAVQALYKAKGRVAARAFIPAQQVADGVVQMQLVEARLDSIAVKENRSTDVDYIRRHIRAQPGELVSVADLEYDLRRFNALHDSKLKAALAPGADFGTTNYQLTVEEPARYQALAFMDNAGRDDVGLERYGLSFASASLFGYRDRLALGLHFSEDFDQGTKGGSVAYDFPINTHGTRISANYDRSNVVVIAGPIEVLNVRGEARNAGLTVRHPFIVSSALRIDGFATFASKKSSTDFDAVELFSVKTRTLSMGADFQMRREAGAAVMRHQITADLKAVGGDGTFYRYNGEYTSTRLHAAEIATTLRMRMQLSSQELLPSTEQFQLGGIASVRGYEEGLLIGDDGYYLSAEASFPLGFESVKSRALFFLDHGGAFPFKGNGEGSNRDDYLTSVGVGFNFALGERLSGRLAVGFPLNDREKSDGKDSPTVHFYIQAASF